MIPLIIHCIPTALMITAIIVMSKICDKQAVIDNVKGLKAVYADISDGDTKLLTGSIKGYSPFIEETTFLPLLSTILALAMPTEPSSLSASSYPTFDTLPI